MSLFVQIMYGSLMLGICLLVHLLLLVLTIRILRFLVDWFEIPMRGRHWALLIAAAIAMVVLAHTAQVWMWAAAFVLLSALPTISDAVYFSLTTYTTLGYGDLIVSDEFRTFAAMAAVTGLLSFGLSTAFLVGLLTRLLPRKIG